MIESILLESFLQSAEYKTKEKMKEICRSTIILLPALDYMYTYIQISYIYIPFFLALDNYHTSWLEYQVPQLHCSLNSGP